MDQQMVQIMEKTLLKLEDISHKLEAIEVNTNHLDSQQQELEGAVLQLRQAVQNDNIIG